MGKTREDHEGQMNDDLLYDLATECETLLDALHEQSRSSKGDSSLATFVAEYQQRFSIWAAHIGVFANKLQSLDSRLRYHGEIKDVVARLLDMLRRSVRHALHLYQTEKDGGKDEEEKRTTLGTLERVLEELNGLGVTIRRSSRTRIDAKIEKFAAMIDPEPFISTANASVDFLYPYADPSLRAYLKKTIIYRYSSMQFERKRREKLQSRRPQQRHIPKQLSPVPELDTGNTTFMNIRTSSVHGHEDVAGPAQSHAGSSTAQRSGPSTLDSKPVREWLNTRINFDTVYPPLPPRSPSRRNRGTSSIQVGQRSYPPLPIEGTANLGMCEWCGEMVDKRQMSDDDWRRHTDRDLRPYVCIAEECKEDHPTYPTFGEWAVHMARQHSPRWYQKAYPSFDWVCLFCKDTQNPFSSPDELHLHLTTNHGSHLTDERLKETSKQCKISRQRARNQCLLCGMVVEVPPAAGAPATLKRQKAHVEKDVPKTPRRSLITRHPGPHTEGQSSSESSDESVDSTQGPTDNTDAKTMARHIGDHLQGLMLLTLRLECLQHDEVPETQRDDGGSDSVDLGDGNDSFRDVEDPENASQARSEGWDEREDDPAWMDEDGDKSEERGQSCDAQIPDTVMPLDDVPRRYDNLPLEADHFLQALILSGAYQGHRQTQGPQQPKNERTGTRRRPPTVELGTSPLPDCLPPSVRCVPPTADDVRECTRVVRCLITLHLELMTVSRLPDQSLAVQKQSQIDDVLEVLRERFRWWMSMPTGTWSEEDLEEIKYLIETLPYPSYCVPLEPSSSANLNQRSPILSFIGAMRKRIRGEKSPRK